MRSSLAKLVLLGLATLVAVPLGVFLVWVLPILVPTKEYKNTTRVRHELSGFSYVISVWQGKNLRPPTSLAEAMATSAEPGLNTLRQGSDPWGSPYYYSVSESAAGAATHYQVMIRSFGPNKQDDNGGLDDLQATYDVFVMEPCEAEPGEQHDSSD